MPKRLLMLGSTLPLFLMAGGASAAVLISQVYGGGGNANAPYQNDFVELCNSGSAPVSLDGWSIQYAATTGISWLNNTQLSGTIPAGSYFLIQLASGGTAGSALPSPDVSGSINMSATAGKMALLNSTALLSGACPSSNPSIVDLVGYGTGTNCFLGASPAPQLSNLLAAVRASCTSGGQNGADFKAAAPNPRSSGGGAGAGGGGGGGGGGPALAAAIYTIQGSGSTSALVGRNVTTSGVVTKINNNGFFIQDQAGDGNPQTSDGIFVFTTLSYPAVALGNLVQVTGTVVEFNVGAASNPVTAANPLTEISSVSAVSLLGSGRSITPITVTLPLAAGDSLERYEGMLVQLQGPLTVQQNYFQARYGQLTLGAGGRHETATNRYRPGTAQALALADSQALGRILLDDGSSLQNVNPTPYLYANGLPRGGDLVGPLTGVLDYGLATSDTTGAGLYRIQPTVAPAFSIGNPRTAAPAAVGGNVRVGAMNVLNFFTTFTNGQTADGQTGQGCSLGASVSASNCRGADSPTEFQRQRTKLLREMAALNPDVLGIMETQNNGNTAVQNLVDGLNAFVGSVSYAAIPVPVAGTGTDAIRVTMIYKPAKLTLVGLPMSDTDPINNRPTLAQTFVAANGEKFSLVVNHLKSKSSCPAAGDANAAGNTDAGDGQGCWNYQRLQQAQRLRTFVAQVQAAAGSSDVLLVGDFNAYAQEDPIYNLTSSGYIDQIGRYNTLGYSYVFDGTAGRLDHAIASASFSPRITGASEWHINADEQLSYDYNLEFKQPACATCAPDPYDGSGPYRASDHDPVLVGVNLYKTIVGTSGRDVLIGTPGDDILIGGAGADQLTGNGGSNQFVYGSVLDGGDTITDFQPGVDLLDFRGLMQSLGYASGDPIANGVVVCTPSGTSAVIGVDPDGAAGPAMARSMVLLRGVSCARALNAGNFIFFNPAADRTQALQSLSR